MLRTFLAPGVEGSFESEAALAPVSAKLANASLVDPLYHGDLMIGLSGLYAITNAIRLAIANRRQLNAGEADKLLRAGFRYLSGRLTPEQAFQSGCRISLWRGMAQAVVENARTRLNVLARIERLVVVGNDRSAAFSAIEEAILQWRPVLMLRRGGRYTVVCGFTRSSLLLFDSGGACWLSKRACGVPGDCENERHMLYPASFMALSA